MKKSILIVIALIMLNGCFYQPKLRPHPDNEEVWVCESPYAKLYWAGEDSYGEIEAGDKLHEVVFFTSAGPQMMVFDKAMIQESDSDMDFEYCLFRGHTTYGEETAIVKVQEDFKNIFNGDLPTLNFKRYDKEDYLKEKENE